MFPRKLKTGTVYYYQCYDRDGNRTNGRSTGQRTRTAAKNYCMNLFREGKLVPGSAAPTFEQFATGWWDVATCKFLQKRQVQNPVAPSTVASYKLGLAKHLLPCFGKFRLDKITAETITEWQVQRAKQGMNSNTINRITGILSVMLGEAVRRKLIETNPVRSVEIIKGKTQEKVILTREELFKMFPEQWETVWDSRLAYMVNKLAAFTGMRLGELLGLKGVYVHEGYLEVCGQFSRFGYGPLKTKDSRNIPITPELYEELKRFTAQNGDGYVFSDDGGGKPVSRSRLYDEVKKAFVKIGISEQEQKERGLAMHHWRHFLNTALLKANVNTLKVQKVTGHKSDSMTRHYSHFDSAEFTEVLDVQKNLLGGAAHSA